MLLAMAGGLQCACSRATALDLEVVSTVCTGIGGLEYLGMYPKNLGISTSRDKMASFLLR